MSQTPDIVKEKENRGIFSFFQRSKKKREQVSIFMPHVKILNEYFYSGFCLDYKLALLFDSLLDCQRTCDPTSEQAPPIFYKVQHHFQTLHFQHATLRCTQEETCPAAPHAHIPG